jgi:SAM-dependent methyltransferase
MPGSAGTARRTGSTVRRDVEDREAAANREVWERRWRQRDRKDFSFHLEVVPPELIELLERAAPPPGAALDLGCGACVVTSFLAERFPVAIGADIAVAALEQAAQLVGPEGGVPRFAAADAAALPFASASLSFVFDRGCLQNMPAAAWPTYFTEIGRVLQPDGILDLWVSRIARRSGGWSARGLAASARRVLTRPQGLDALSGAYLQQLAPPELSCSEVGEIPFRTATGQERMWVHGVFEKRA